MVIDFNVIQIWKDKGGINIETNSLTVVSLGRSTSLVVRGEYKHSVRYFVWNI